jgi:hypothetical protein
VNCFVVYDIETHQLSLKQFINLKFLDEIPFKKCVFLHFFVNEYKIIYSF